MTDLLIITVLVGAATSAAIELLDMLLEFIVFINISKAALKKFFVLPLTIGGAYLLGSRLPNLPVVSLAALLISLCITMWLDKPTVVQRPVPRLY